MFTRLRLLDDFYIEGIDFIYLLQHFALRWEALSAQEALTGLGELAKPWILRTPVQWLRAARTDKTTDRYVQVGGRILRRNKRLFISDQGPAWKYKPDAYDPTNKEEIATDYKQVDKKLKAFEGNLNTPYRYIAQRVEEPTAIFTHTDEEKNQLGPDWARQTWSQAAKTKTIAQTMRNLLTGEKLSIADLGKDYSRMQHMLPLLVVAMYLAESGRNTRAMAINLMLLDLAERSIHIPNIPDQLNFVNMLVHPLLAPRNVNRQESLKEEIEGVHGRAKIVDDLKYTGGLMPYSPLEGADANSPKFANQPSQQELAQLTEQHRATRLANTRKIIRFDMNYVNKKEVDVIIRWLIAVEPSFRGMYSSEPTYSHLKRIQTQDLVWPDFGWPYKSLTGQLIRQIHLLILRRMSNFQMI